jgi:DNA-binding transcriptional MerR regulator
MQRKNNLLSIGEMYKLTGVGIKTLRYYEEIGLFRPIYTDPESAYRYYSIDQTHLLEMIVFCSELGIPLKEVAKWIDKDEGIDLEIFMARGKEIAEKKMKSITKGLALIAEIEKKLVLAKKYPPGEIYSRKIPAKTYHVKQFDQSLADITPSDLGRAFIEMPFAEYWDIAPLEYGTLRKHTPSGSIFYFFSEVPNRTKGENLLYIPGGEYMCMRNTESQIEQAVDIFNEYLSGDASYIAVETEDISTGRSSDNKSMCELRVIRS